MAAVRACVARRAILRPARSFTRAKRLMSMELPKTMRSIQIVPGGERRYGRLQSTRDRGSND